MIHYEGHGVQLHHGDCLDVLRTLPDASVDAVVTDPPYGLEFMGKDWDAPWKDPAAHAEARLRRSAEVTPTGQAHSTSAGPYLAAGVNKYAAGLPFQRWCELWAAECLRVLKPGGHLLAFGGTRTWHRLTCAVEDAGFEIRDSIAWLYGSGFPKSLDVSKAIDKAAGAEREVMGLSRSQGMALRPGRSTYVGGEGIDRTTGTAPDLTAPATPDAQTWQGWGTALKPAFEPVVVARKPLTGTVAATVLQHGTGALNIAACRVETTDNLNGGAYAEVGGRSESASLRAGGGMNVPGKTAGRDYVAPAGRWPANVVLDENQAATLDEMSGDLAAGGFPTKVNRNREHGVLNNFTDETRPDRIATDTGGASRFFYVAKADADERPRHNGTSHPTVKPLSLMRWLVRLVTPPGGTVLEPFAGSGTTVEACVLEGFHCIAIEKGEEYLPLIMSRITRQRDPVAAIKLAGEDLGLFGLDGWGA